MLTTSTQDSVTTASRPQSPASHGLLNPVGMADLRQRDLYREFARWPSMLWLPAIVAVLTIVGMHSVLAAVPCALALSTAAVLTSVHRACKRLHARSEIAAITDLIPYQRSANSR